MQIGGLGGSHSASDHHVTNCIHDHHDVKKDTGGMAMKASAAAEASTAKSELLQEANFSLAAWLKNMLGSGRGFLLGIWGEGAAADGVEGNRTAAGGMEGGQAAFPAAIHTEGTDTVTAAAASVQPEIRSNPINNNSYNSGTKGTKKQKHAIWKRAMDHFHNMSGRSDSRRSQRLLGFQVKKSSCPARREHPGEEELRRQNRYRRDTVEINIARTEDNYLMDSYDRKGEYSRLTTKK